MLICEALLEKARAGDPSALERLLKIHQPDLVRYARRLCASDDVEEAVQDSLWILYRRVGGLRSIAAFAGWLYQVVRRTCLKYARSRRARRGLDELPEGQDRDLTAANAELVAVMSSIIAGLPLRYREVLVLKDIRGLSITEISAALSISPDAAKGRLHRARAMVRDAYQA